MNRIRRHGAQFVLALLLALALWAYVSFTTNPTATLPVNVPVQAANLPTGMIVVNTASGLPENLIAATTIEASGPQEDIRGLTGSDFQAQVDLAHAVAGINTIAIDVTGPRLVRIRSRKPAELTLRLANELIRTVPVTVTLQGQPPFSFSIGHMTQGAREASVRGPEELVSRVVAAVANVTVQGQTNDIQSTIALVPVDETGESINGVKVTPESVAVQVPISAQFGLQQVSVVPDLTGQPAPGYAVGSIDWSPKIVEVFTTGVITGTFSTDQIDLSGLTTAITRTVGLARLPNVITTQTDVQITVRVSIVPISVPSQVPLFVPISSIGLQAGFTASARPAVMQVTLAGPFARLSKLTSDEISATVDLSGLAPGTYSLPVRIQAPRGLTIVAPRTPTVQVTLIAPPPTPTPTPPPTPTLPRPTPDLSFLLTPTPLHNQ